MACSTVVLHCSRVESTVFMVDVPLEVNTNHFVHSALSLTHSRVTIISLSTHTAKPHWPIPIPTQAALTAAEAL